MVSGPLGRVDVGGVTRTSDREALMSTSLIDPALRPTSARRAPEPSASHEMTAVRAWARSRGYPIDECAGVPLVVLKTYRRVHGG